MIFALGWARIVSPTRPSTALSQGTLRQTVTKEAALFFGLLFFGLVLSPIALYLAGDVVFGAYGGHGYGEFFGNLGSRIRQGDLAAWWFVLTPYLIWQVLRLTVLGWRSAGRRHSP